MKQYFIVLTLISILLLNTLSYKACSENIIFSVPTPEPLSAGASRCYGYALDTFKTSVSSTFWESDDKKTYVRFKFTYTGESVAFILKADPPTTGWDACEYLGITTEEASDGAINVKADNCATVFWKHPGDNNFRSCSRTKENETIVILNMKGEYIFDQGGMRYHKIEQKIFDARLNNLYDD